MLNIFNIIAILAFAGISLVSPPTSSHIFGRKLEVILLLPHQVRLLPQMVMVLMALEELSRIVVDDQESQDVSAVSLANEFLFKVLLNITLLTNVKQVNMLINSSLVVLMLYSYAYDNAQRVHLDVKLTHIYYCQFLPLKNIHSL
ncbi:hypothetical protein BDC45DRAFT_533789 [Circinella umbellata]|nr:hypothetical protein BDC45DRAFT_533789 [Circinella umbellata]